MSETLSRLLCKVRGSFPGRRTSVLTYLAPLDGRRLLIMVETSRRWTPGETVELSGLCSGRDTLYDDVGEHTDIPRDEWPTWLKAQLYKGADGFRWRALADVKDP